jgi:hypothetical protein
MRADQLSLTHPVWLGPESRLLHSCPSGSVETLSPPGAAVFLPTWPPAPGASILGLCMSIVALRRPSNPHIRVGAKAVVITGRLRSPPTLGDVSNVLNEEKKQ